MEWNTSDFETPSSNWEIGKADKWSVGMSLFTRNQIV